MSGFEESNDSTVSQPVPLSAPLTFLTKRNS